MTGRERIAAALSPAGSDELGAVVCYTGIFVRDHWSALTDRPWWVQWSPSIDEQLAWHREIAQRLDQDWVRLPAAAPRAVRERTCVEVVDPQRLRLTDRQDGVSHEIEQPQVSGWSPSAAVESVHPAKLAESEGEVEAAIPAPQPFDAAAFVSDGCADLAQAILADFGAELYPIAHVCSPLWLCYQLWGFDGMMTQLALEPELVKLACQRYLDRCLRDIQVAATLGAHGIWIEECLTDLVSPPMFERFNLPGLQAIVEAIRAAGMQSIYYYCGDPDDRYDLLLSAGADALALEEAKKGFSIDILDVVERVGGQCAVFGNLDAIGVLQDGDDAALQAAVAAQVDAGRRHGGRFVVSVGSPVTPGTKVERVRRFIDLAHALGRGCSTLDPNRARPG